MCFLEYLPLKKNSCHRCHFPFKHQSILFYNTTPPQSSIPSSLLLHLSISHCLSDPCQRAFHLHRSKKTALVSHHGLHPAQRKSLPRPNATHPLSVSPGHQFFLLEYSSSGFQDITLLWYCYGISAQVSLQIPKSWLHLSDQHGHLDI